MKKSILEIVTQFTNQLALPSNCGTMIRDNMTDCICEDIQNLGLAGDDCEKYIDFVLDQASKLLILPRA